MGTLDARRTYSDGAILFEADLDAVIDDIETFVNTTKLNDDNIQDNGITASTKLVNASVTAGKLATDSVTTTKIVDANVTTVKIADSNVTTAKIADSNVTTAKIADSNVTTAKIADSNVTTAKIADSNVTTAKILDANVTNGKLGAGAVNPVKITVNKIESGLSGSYSNSGSSITPVTNLSVAITSSGKNIHVWLQSDGTGNPSYVSSTGTTAVLYIYRDSTIVGAYPLSNHTIPSSAFYFMETPAAGTYTYTCRVNPNSETVNVTNVILIASEGF